MIQQPRPLSIYRHDTSKRGSALIVILAFLLLLTTITIAFLGRATLERLLSGASLNQNKVDIVGQGAISTILADLQQEVVAGSNGTGTPTMASGFYYPTSPLAAVPCPMVPVDTGATGTSPAVTVTASLAPTVGMENLLKESYYNTPFYSAIGSGTYYTTTPAAPVRGSSVSTATPSLNNRSVSAARWNKPLLLAKEYPSSTSTLTPVTNFVVPNWVYVARDGSNPGATSTTFSNSYIYSANISPLTTPSSATPYSNAVTQRFAYAIYDEGGTLDLNVAGSPMYGSAGSGTYSPLAAYKSALSYADLTQLPYLGTTAWTVSNGSGGTTASGVLTAANAQTIVNAIVGWRNNASGSGTYTTPLISGSFPAYTFAAAGTGTINPFDAYVQSTGNGFMSAAGTSIVSSTGQTDSSFGSRQQLIQFLLQGVGNSSATSPNTYLSNLQNALPYLGTFSRDINQPSYSPDPNRPVVLNITSGGNDMAGQLSTSGTYTYSSTAATTGQNAINPAFLNVMATSAYTRNDGSIAKIGEPLVKKRFALSRLAWLTYKGPSALRTQYALGSASPGTTSADYDMWELVNIYGVSPSLLAQGTAANIQAYFGLSWITDNSTSVGINDGTLKWKYEHGTNQTSAGVMTSGTPGRIMTLAQVQSTGRDPDFFELLKAAVTVGAIAKPGTPIGSLSTPAGYQNAKDASVDAYIIQLGANIIAQSNVAQYCPRIIFDDGTWLLSGSDVPQEYRGVEDLPYLYRMRGTHIKISESNPVEASSPMTATTNQYANSPFPSGFTSTGTGEFLQVPEIFNPHNWNPNVTPALKPTSFQIIPLSADPLNINAGNPTALGSSQTLAHSNNNGGITGTVTGTTTTYSPSAGGVNFNDSPGNQGELAPFFINGEKITFSVPLSTTGAGFFREPTLLNKPDPGSTSFFGPPVGSNVAASGFATLAAGGNAQSNAQITSYYKANCYVSNASAPSCIAPSSTTDNQLYLGFNFGTVPLWIPDPSTTTTSTATPMVMTTAVTVGGNNTNFTYQLQYLDPNGSGKYITYDEKFLPLSICGPSGGGNGMNSPLNTFLCGSQNTSNYSQAAAGTSGSGASGWGYYDLVEMDNYLVLADPRTARFSPAVFTSGQTGAGLAAPPYQYAEAESRWVDLSQNALTTARPDYNAGWDVLGSTTSGLGFYNMGNTGPLAGNVKGFVSLFAQNWVSASYSANTGLCVGDSQGTGISGTQYYADPDGMVRRGSAAYSNAPGTPASTAVPPAAYNGLPLQTSTTYAKSGTTVTATPITDTSRPIVLNRPFRSVAELGYTFSGTPGKNIDFATPESGYSALLDVFCINDTNDPSLLLAGKISLNTRQAPVLNAILAGAYKDEYNPTTTGIAAADAGVMTSVASYGLISRTTNSTSSSYGPLRNISELAGKFVSSSSISGTTPAASDGSLSYSGFSSDLANTANTTLTDNAAPNRNMVQRFHETSIRALSAAGTTRVWNLMIDVIAQAGRFPSTATSFANFNVEGERRYWVHVAIDRYTGKVLDEQIEEVKE